MSMKPPRPVERLLARGVKIPNPFCVDIGEEVDPERVSTSGVVLYAGTKISGPKTLISSGVKLGGEAPVTVTDCRLGRDVVLKGGFFKSSVFLNQANMGSGAQIREGCLLEEEANGSHTVGLKQTILFPFVTLGSLINFCDALISGGTSRRDHSEVGSSYIHFNYTPNQDKATASLLGDVPRGVMLREPPIFLGGQGGLVGPARIGFGTVIAAGEIWREDCPEGGKLLRGAKVPSSVKDFHPGLYGDIRRRVTNNVLYLSNLKALRQWYLHVRFSFPGDPEMGDALRKGAVEILDTALAERLTRFKALADKMPGSIEIGGKFLPAEHREAIFVGGQIVDGLVGRHGAGNEPNGVEREKPERLAGDGEMSLVDGIERAAEESDGARHQNITGSSSAATGASGSTWPTTTTGMSLSSTQYSRPWMAMV